MSGRPTRVALSSLIASSHQRAEFAEYVASGGSFAYPTATVYGLGSAIDGNAVAALTALKRRPDSKRFLIVSGSATSFDGLAWTPDARRLAAHFWPGRLTLILGDPDGSFAAELAGPGGAVAVRHSAHFGVRALEWAVGSPITSTSANPPGQPPALDAAEAVRVLEELGAADGWVIDGGRLGPSPSSTIVDCSGDRPVVVREGTYSVAEIEQALNEEPTDSDLGSPGPFSILFVCTGNTCRSPLAEVIAQRLIDELGWVARASSAGVYAGSGAPASHESVVAARDHGMDLSGHQSRHLDHALAQDADLILTMGPGHLEAVGSLGAGGKAALLSAFAAGSADPFDGPPIVDPFGQAQSVYDATYDALSSLISRSLDRLAPVLALDRNQEGSV